MQIIETPYHYTFTDYSDLPTYSCTGKCKKSWWSADIKDHHSGCPQCGSSLKDAVKNTDYQIVQSANRALRLSDFKKYGGMSHKDKLRLKNLIQRGVEITNLGLVKSGFEEKAKTEWC